MLMNRAMLMEQFLSVIKIFAQYNPDREIDYRFVYSQLLNFGLGSLAHKENLKDIWPQISSMVASVTDSNTINRNNGPFLLFDRGHLNGNEIKMYLPAPKENIIDVVCTIEKILTKNNMTHQLKVASSMRNDNIVVRVNSLDDAKLIMEKINTSKLLEVNPFLASNNGIGLAMDNNDSFNSVLSGLIASYIMDLREHKKLNDVSLMEFRNFIKRERERLERFNLNSQKLDLVDIYRLLELTTNYQFKIADFYNFANQKQVDKYNIKRERITDPEFYLEQVIRETNKKYPQNQGRALIEALQGNYTYFTNECFARDGLKKYVKPETVKKIMQQKVQIAGFTIPDDENSLY